MTKLVFSLIVAFLESFVRETLVWTGSQQKIKQIQKDYVLWIHSESKMYQI